jgi:hypothetical protein
MNGVKWQSIGSTGECVKVPKLEWKLALSRYGQESEEEKVGLEVNLPVIKYSREVDFNEPNLVNIVKLAKLIALWPCTA